MPSARSAKPHATVGTEPTAQRRCRVRAGRMPNGIGLANCDHRNTGVHSEPRAPPANSWSHAACERRKNRPNKQGGHNAGNLARQQQGIKLTSGTRPSTWPDTRGTAKNAALHTSYEMLGAKATTAFEAARRPAFAVTHLRTQDRVPLADPPYGCYSLPVCTG